MSLQAMLWALYGVAPEEADPEQRLILLVLADHAGPDGTGAYPSKKTIAEATGLSRATVYRKLAGLQMKGLVRLGDQQLVAHYSADRRPVVYDLSTGNARGLTLRPRDVSTGSQTGSHAETQTNKPETERTRGRAREQRAPRGRRCAHGVVIASDGMSCDQCPPMQPVTEVEEA